VSAHTPGPWLWNDKQGSLHRAPSDGVYRYGDVVLSPSYEYESGVNVEVSDADAALIASAPTMADYIGKKAIEGDEEARAILESINAPR
jgi:hypothetical protein